MDVIHMYDSKCEVKFREKSENRLPQKEDGEKPFGVLNFYG